MLEMPGPVRREVVIGQMRRVGFRRVVHGVFLPTRDDLDDDAEFVRDVVAVLAVCGPDAVATHVSAARVLGWRVPPLPDHVPFFVATSGDGRRARRPGVVASRLRRTARASVHPDIPVDNPEEIVLRMARDVGVLDLVVVIDSALALGHLEARHVEDLLRSGRPGVRALRRAWLLADRRSESSPETLLRVMHASFDIPVEPQRELWDADGVLVGRADLHVLGTYFAHEYDGAVHRSANRHQLDLRRERRFAGTAWERRGFTMSDIVTHPAVTMHELDRALGRRHAVRRLRRWRALLDESLYSPAGRARVAHRWRRTYRTLAA